MKKERTKCMVCGWLVTEDFCPRCGTALLKDREICHRCGTIMDKGAEICDGCGLSLPKITQEREEAIQRFTLVPGIDRETASELYDKGFKDFTELIALSLPPKARKKGLDRILARRIILSSMMERRGKKEEGMLCPVCRSPLGFEEKRCKVCGTTPFIDEKGEEIREKLGDLLGQIYSNLSKDLDFKTMPKHIRNEIGGAFMALNEKELLMEEYRQQVEAWRERGLEVSSLEKLLEENMEAFRKESVKIIRAQILKKAVDGKFKCPLCEVDLPPESMECYNCGARFGRKVKTI